MGVSVESKGKRGMGIELNLVPFIEFLACLLAFLMMTAVMTDLAALPLAQHVGAVEGSERDVDAPPPLTVHVEEAGAWVGSRVDAGELVARGEAGIDWSAVEAKIAADRAAFPGERVVVVNTDDGQPYEDMTAALDLAYRYDYADALLSGGPPAVTPK
jgi:biopolymer transport protein ExbD